MVIPAGMSGAWVSAYLRALGEGCGLEDAAHRASGLEKGGMRHANRLTLYGGGRIVEAGIPLAGGGSVLKRRDADPLVSGHGKWKQEHLGAWRAVYGRTPWFGYLMPEIEQIYADTFPGSRLEEFSQKLLDLTLRWSGVVEMMRELNGADGERKSRIFEIGGLIREECGERWEWESVAGLLFRRGLEGAFALLEGGISD